MKQGFRLLVSVDGAQERFLKIHRMKTRPGYKLDFMVCHEGYILPELCFRGEILFRIFYPGIGGVDDMTETIITDGGSGEEQEKALRKAREEAGYQILSSRMAYKNPWTAVREDIIIHPGGQKGLYGVVERGAFAVIMPLHANGNVTLVQQFRYPVGKRLWEFPMGMWEMKKDVKAEELALGELREETGLRARELIPAGELYQGAGYSTQKGYVFLARDLVRGEAEREATESDMTVRDLPLAAFEEMIRTGALTCMVTIAAFAQIRLRGLI